MTPFNLSTGLTTTSSVFRLSSSRRSSRSDWLRPSPKWKVGLRVGEVCSATVSGRTRVERVHGQRSRGNACLTLQCQGQNIKVKL